MEEPNMLSGLQLAFVGDAVYGLLVRKELANTKRPIKELHALSVEMVNATAQARYFEVISSQLTEDEMTVFKRGRNSKASNVPKHSLVGEYHTATGLEALFGYLYLTHQTDRLDYLFKQMWEAFIKEKD